MQFTHALLALVCIGGVTTVIAAASPSARAAAARATRLPRCAMCAAAAPMPTLPADVVKYSQVPKDGAFTKERIPSGLLKEHSTKKGTWGRIQVSSGELRYQINEGAHKGVHVLRAPAVGIIEPAVHHEVKPLTDDLKFVVEFLRVPGTGPVDEKREP